MSTPGRVLVTGGAGYIGSHTVVSLMTAGVPVTVIDNLERSEPFIIEGIESITQSKVDFYKLDCRDKVGLIRIFESNPISSVIHFAAYKSVGESVLKPTLYYENNVGSLITLIDVMRQFNVPDIIFSSSCTVYGQPEIIPVTETAPFKRAESPYGATKQFCERILEDVASIGMRVVALRYFNPIGAHPSAQIGELPVGVPTNLVPYVTQTAAGVRKSLTVFGDDYNTPDGSCVRDFIHVMDVASAHVEAVHYLKRQHKGPFFEAFNLGTGTGVSVLELVNRFMAVTKEQLSFSIGPRRPGDVEKVYADPSKIQKAFGWSAQHTLGESLLDAWRWEKKIRKK